MKDLHDAILKMQRIGLGGVDAYNNWLRAAASLALAYRPKHGRPWKATEWQKENLPTTSDEAAFWDWYRTLGSDENHVPASHYRVACAVADAMCPPPTFTARDIAQLRVTADRLEELGDHLCEPLREMADRLSGGRACEWCGGSGTEERVAYAQGQHGDREQQACSSCDGTGKATDYSCRVCGVQCPTAPRLPARAVCEAHCEDHQYDYDPMRRGRFCRHCDRQREEEYFDDDVI